MKIQLVVVVAVSVFAAFARPAPCAALMERLRAEEDVIGIVHLGLNTYTDREWGYGHLAGTATVNFSRNLQLLSPEAYALHGWKKAA